MEQIDKDKATKGVMITPKTHARLAARGSWGTTMDSIITKLLDRDDARIKALPKYEPGTEPLGVPHQ